MARESSSASAVSMSPFLKPEWLEEFRDSIRQQAIDIAIHVAHAMMNREGRVFGEVKLSSEEVILKFIEDLATGTVDNLAALNPEEFERQLREFRRAAEKEGF